MTDEPLEPLESLQARVDARAESRVSSDGWAAHEAVLLLRDGGRLALTCWHNRHTTSSILVRHALEKAGVPWPDTSAIKTPHRPSGSGKKS